MRPLKLTGAGHARPSEARGWQPGPPAARMRESRYEATRLSMACVYAIVAHGPEPAVLPDLVEAAFDEVDRIDRLMSHYKADSPLSQINREAAQRPVTVEPELFDFIAESLRYSRESDGAFDITVGPLMKAWGFFRGEGRLPAPREIAAVRERVGYHHVVLDEAARTIRFDRPGVELDLGGIAKGYAVDRVVQMLRAKPAQVQAALVSAGGSTVYAMGSPPDADRRPSRLAPSTPGERADWADGWEVSIQDPINARATALTVRLKDRALSVAGRAEKSFTRDGVTYSHIMDPRTAKPVQGVLSVAVLSDSGTAGDALDDLLFVQGLEASRAWLAAREPLAGAFFFLPDRARGWTLAHLGR